MYYLYHVLAFVLGFLLDLLLGDPYSLPHPIRLIGKWIAWLTDQLLGKKHPEHALTSKAKRLRGLWLVLLVCLPVLVITLVLVLGAYIIHPYLGLVVEAIMTYQCLATKCLKVESMKVYDKLQQGNLAEARVAVSMIVGRDTQELTEVQVAKAAVETVAENTSDGVIAPMLCLAIGGPVLGFWYKAVNTMDSMVGYKNEKFMDFGSVAAHTDDAWNYIPSRVSALLMILACCFLGKTYDPKEALRIFKRDRFNHASPNSAQTEAACAGALHLQLAGPARYFGQLVEKPYIGDNLRPIEIEDIRRANRLLYATAFLCQGFCLLGMGIFVLVR